MRCAAEFVGRALRLPISTSASTVPPRRELHLSRIARRAARQARDSSASPAREVLGSTIWRSRNALAGRAYLRRSAGIVVALDHDPAPVHGPDVQRTGLVDVTSISLRPESCPAIPGKKARALELRRQRRGALEHRHDRQQDHQQRHAAEDREVSPAADPPVIVAVAMSHPLVRANAAGCVGPQARSPPPTPASAPARC